MEKIVEEVKGIAVAALFAGLFLAFVYGLFGLTGGGAGGDLGDAITAFVQSIGGGGH